MKAGFIGYKGFAKKLEYLFRTAIPGLDILFYHPRKMLPNCPFTNDLNDLFGCDFIVIASPDKTHYDYIRKLKSFSGYIFCEKIPAVNFRQLGYLEKQKNDKLYFNFNYRKSILSDILKTNKKEMLYINYISSMGLALRDNYRKSWRAQADLTPLGVFQTSGIHMLDLLLYDFGYPSSYHYHYTNISPCGNSLDNFYLSMTFDTENRFEADLYYSYTAPYMNRIDIVSTEKLIQITDSGMRIRGPREYTKNGRFASPPITKSKKINFYETSLLRSVNYFVDIIRKKNKFFETCELKNYLGNRFFLTLQKEIAG